MISRLFRLPRMFFVLMLLTFLCGTVRAQHSAPAERRSQSSAQENKPEKSKTEKASEQTGLGAELAETSREAAGEDEAAEFKHSATVRWLARATGLSPFTAYWVFVILNFVIILAVLVGLMKSRVPAMFRARTEAIQKGIQEARKASEEARARLSEIESRLAKLDAEIAAMTAAAEADAGKEEARIHAAAEEDKTRVVQQAEQEIEAAVRVARSELRAYVSELAVDLAKKRIQVSAAADQELVRAFVDQLGENGK